MFKKMILLLIVGALVAALVKHFTEEA